MANIGRSSVSFFGLILSDDGILPYPENVACLSNANAPTTVSELKSFLGLCTYMSRFIQKFSEKPSLLCELTKKNSKFIWTEHREYAFNLLKTELTTESVVSFFEPRKLSTVWVDASNYAVGGILLQPDDDGHPRPVCYIRALSETEQKYSVTEKEALRLVFCIEKWHVYLYHTEFDVIVDHNPLFHIRTRESTRIERWQMKLQRF